MKEAFKEFIFEANTKGSRKADSYLKALEYLDSILDKPSSMYSHPVDFWTINSPDEIERLYNHVLKFQKIEKEFLLPGKKSYALNHYYSAALKSYLEFLSYSKNKLPLSNIANVFEDSDNEDAFRDMVNTLNDDSIPKTERETIAKSRIGQGKFRKDLIKFWNRCSVTGFPQVKLLRASHIKPWKASDNKERLDVYNGLLLLPNLDLVFDKGFITFDDKGKIVISNALEKGKALGLESGMSITIKPKHNEYLEHHRKEVFEKSA